jgi:hypothetical protein
MTAAYKEKIVEAFRDNAIRSVLLIDDEYHPYKNLVENNIALAEKFIELNEFSSTDINEYKSKLEELNALNLPIQRSDIAKEFVDFFHKNKQICDVESNTESLDHEKIRKSDLIVLDYYLKSEGSENRAEFSLELIHQLSNSKHMNVVVVYTNEPLKTVWLEISATLRGAKSISEDSFDKQVVKNKWNDLHLEWLEEWEKYVSYNMQRDYILGIIDLKNITKDFREICALASLDKPFKDHVSLLLESSIAALNKNNKEYANINIHGESEVWIQAGDVFIVLCSKEENESPPQVWESIKTALHSWNPSFYRVVTSELQNQIEDANLSMEKSISYLDKDQMAFLWGILQTEEKDKGRITRELLGNIANEALDRILYNSSFISDIVETTKLINEPLIEHVSWDKNNVEPYKEFQRNILKLSAKNVVNDADYNEEKQYQIAHAYNERLSTTPHFPKYITTGSILRDEDDNWYICVTPSCNTVPNQVTDLSISALKPHRALTFTKLIKTKSIKDALHNAHHSSYIYITSQEDETLAFSVIKDESKLPDLLKVVVMNHDNEEWENDGFFYKEMTLFITKTNTEGLPEIKHETKKIYPVALLKPAYAARYQNIQSHYEGRIGVDFLTLDLSPAEDTD